MSIDSLYPVHRAHSGSEHTIPSITSTADDAFSTDNLCRVCSTDMCLYAQYTCARPRKKRQARRRDHDAICGTLLCTTSHDVAFVTRLRCREISVRWEYDLLVPELDLLGFTCRTYCGPCYRLKNVIEMSWQSAPSFTR